MHGVALGFKFYEMKFFIPPDGSVTAENVHSIHAFCCHAIYYATDNTDSEIVSTNTKTDIGGVTVTQALSLHSAASTSRHLPHKISAVLITQQPLFIRISLCWFSSVIHILYSSCPKT